MIMTQGMRQMSMAMKQPVNRLKRPIGGRFAGAFALAAVKQPAGGPGIQHADTQSVYPALCKGEGQLRIAGEDTENQVGHHVVLGVQRRDEIQGWNSRQQALQRGAEHRQQQPGHQQQKEGNGHVSKQRAGHAHADGEGGGHIQAGRQGVEQ